MRYRRVGQVQPAPATRLTRASRDGKVSPCSAWRRCHICRNALHPITCLGPTTPCCLPHACARQRPRRGVQGREIQNFFRVLAAKTLLDVGAGWPLSDRPYTSADRRMLTVITLRDRWPPSARDLVHCGGATRHSSRKAREKEVPRPPVVVMLSSSWCCFEQKNEKLKTS